MNRSLVIDIICFLYIVLLVYAALTKLLEYEKFTIQIGQSPLLSRVADFIAWFIPSLEVLIATGLAFGGTRLISLYAGFTLMLIFTGYIIAITSFSDYVPCSCGGVLEKFGWTEHLIFNIGFVLLGGTAIVFSNSTEFSNDHSL